jgi:hypothetical protein
MENRLYERKHGDDLLSDDPRLRYKWEWSRVASQIPAEELKKWTHFQCSQAVIGDWTLETTQWSDDDTVSYEATVTVNGNCIVSKEGFPTRIAAALGAEKLLKDWIQSEWNKLNSI